MPPSPFVLEGYYLYIYLFIYLLKAYSAVNRTGSPQGFSQVLNLVQVEYSTKHARYIKGKAYKHNPKVSPFGIALVKHGK